jgi:regulator of replication initiation timing
LIEGDSLYYDRNKNLLPQPKCKITDSVNRGIVKGHYAEMYKTGFHVCHQRAVAVNFVENDSVYIHGKKIDGDR